MHEPVLLKELARQVRRDTVGLFEAAPQDRLTWAPPGTANHVLWRAGHALWLQDQFIIQPLTGESEVSLGWQAMFASGSNPQAPEVVLPAQRAIAHVTKDPQATAMFRISPSTPTPAATTRCGATSPGIASVSRRRSSRWSTRPVSVWRRTSATSTWTTPRVADFVLALTDPAAYEHRHGFDPVDVGDINQDGAFDTADVAAFVDMLTGNGHDAVTDADDMLNGDGHHTSIPEPGTLGMLGLAGLMLLRRHRRR